MLAGALEGQEPPNYCPDDTHSAWERDTYTYMISNDYAMESDDWYM